MAPDPIPLAIIGIGCRFPGDADSPSKLWELLANKQSAWSAVPEDRWNEKAFRHPSPDDNNGSHNHSGGHFLSQDVGEFDAGFFNIMPQEASAMDPQQRILLETTYDALESAGIPHDEVLGSNTSVHMAIFTRDYDRNAYKDMLDIPKYHLTGTGEAILANRISYAFDLRGPSMTIDTGCSGGMTAVHQACQSLRSGETDMALAGGANLILSPDHMISMTNLHMLSADGKSYSFDERANGYGRGEGVATLVLKRLDNAIRDRDPIRAIIRESAINQDGHTQGITLPSSEAQAALQIQAWKRVGLDPSEVDYVEAHGTGTAAGDRKELDAISNVFSGNSREVPLYVGSIKSNIGHLECVSGLAALIKSTLMLERGLIAPNVNFENARTDLHLDEKKIKIPTKIETLGGSGATKRISVNSFGYGGSNSHVILEQFPKSATHPQESLNNTNPTDKSRIPRLIVLSAKSRSSLTHLVGATAEWTKKQHVDCFLPNMSYTLCQRRSHFSWRFSCVASRADELAEQLNKGTMAEMAVRDSSDINLTFVFTGQGAQWPRMGCELLSTPIFRESMQRSGDILRDLGASWDLNHELLQEDAMSRLHMAELAQPVTTAVQIGLVDLLKALKISPTSVVGHSSGEVAAAYCAGYLSHYSALKIAYFRGFSSQISKSMGCPKGAMLSVGLGEIDIAPYLSRITTGIASVACQNSPQSTTISGDETAIEELADLLTKDEIFNRKLRVDTAYHSHHMQAAADQYKASLGDIEVLQSTGSVDVFSSVTGIKKDQNFGVEYWVSNLVSKVRFCDALQALSQEYQGRNKHQIFVEIGPHAALAGPTRQSVAEFKTTHDYNSALVRGTDGMRSLLVLIGKLFERGYKVELGSIISSLDPLSETARVLHDLPSYPWDHSKRYWHESRVSREYRLRQNPYHDLLGTRVADSTPLHPRWRHMLGISSLPWLADHVIDGLVIFPGSGYVCMAIEGAKQLVMDRAPNINIESIYVKKVSFLKGLIIPEAPERIEVQLAFNPVPASNGFQYNFSIAAWSDGEICHEHCTGVVGVELELSDEKDIQTLQEPDHYSFDHASARSIGREQLYSDLDSVGNSYGPMFSGIENLAFNDFHAACDISVPDVASVMPSKYLRPHIIHPTTLDIIVHSSLPLIMQKLGRQSTMIVGMEELSISARKVNHSKLSAYITLNSTRIRAAEVDVSVKSQFPSGDAFPFIQISGMEIRSIGDSSNQGTISDNPHDICYEMKWGADVDFCSNLAANSDVRSQKEKIDILNQATLLYISQCLPHISDKDVQQPYHKLLVSWMSRHLSGSNLTDLSDNQILRLASLRGVEGEFLTRLGPELADIITGKANALQIMLEDDLLYRVYADDSSARCYALMREYVSQLCFKKAHLSVLEIGAGTGGASLPFLQAMKAQGSDPARYDFTDVSAGFFDRVREKLGNWSDMVNFKTLDIERDPREQGFEEGTYDVVLASNVLHATASIRDTLARVRSLLKTNGKLVLIEVTNPQPYLNITFGCLPGWWKGAGEGRTDGPFLSPVSWGNALSESFMPVQMVAHDDPSSPLSSLIIATAETMDKLSAPAAMQLITPSDISANMSEIATRFADLLTINGHKASLSSWARFHTESPTVRIVLDDGSAPVLANVTPDLLKPIITLLAHSKPKVLWITCSNSQEDATDARRHLINGVSRTAHAENENLQLVTVDLQTSSDTNISDGFKHVMKILQQLIDYPRDAMEREYIITGEKVLVPRVIPHTTLNKWISNSQENFENQETLLFKGHETALRLDMGKQNSAAKYTFTVDESHAQGLHETGVEIDACAFGQPISQLQSTLYEYSGIVMAIGKDVHDIKVGDRVVGLAPTVCANRPRIDASMVHQIPAHTSFTTAAGIPMAFMTAYKVLVEICNIQPGYTVLVNGASSYIGQVVTRVLLKLGAKVIFTASDQTEVNTLGQLYKVTNANIIPRGGFRCRQALRNHTRKHGDFDVVINPSGSGLSTDIAHSVKEFGNIVNISSSLNIDQHILPNVTVSSFDLGAFLRVRSQESSGLFQKAMKFAFEFDIIEYLQDIKIVKSLTETAVVSDFSITFPREKVIVAYDGNSTVQVSKPFRETLYLDSDATFVVSGGLGDLGKRFLRLMAKAGAKHLVTLSRRGADTDAIVTFQSQLETIAPDCRLYCLKCNVADANSVNEARNEMKRLGLPQVKGVIQTAFILRDSTLHNMTAEAFNSVLDAKMHGTLNLHNVFSEKSQLQFFITLSSATGVLGTSGQANYNAGNTFQDALAQLNKDSGCHYLSLDIGTIEGADTTVNNNTRIEALRRQGLKSVLPDELLAFFGYAMSPSARRSGCHQAIIGFNAETVAQTTAINGTAHSLIFTHVHKNQNVKLEESDAGSHQVTFQDIIATSTDMENTIGFITESIATRLASLISIDASDIDPNESLSAFGFDSLVAIELRNWIMREFNAPLQTSEIIDDQDLLTLARKVASRSLALKDAAAESSSDTENTAKLTPTTSTSTGSGIS